MDLKLDEQMLVANFRQLPEEGKMELKDYAASLVKKYRDAASEKTEQPANQCSLGKQPEKRPEIAKEPVFTE